MNIEKPYRSGDVDHGVGEACGLAFVRMNAYTESMSNISERPSVQRLAKGAWPIVPLIRVVTGYESGVGLVSSQLAIKDAAGCYRLLGGGLLVPNTGDVIETWEEMTAVPVHRASQITASPLRSNEIHVSGPSAL